MFHTGAMVTLDGTKCRYQNAQTVKVKHSFKWTVIGPGVKGSRPSLDIDGHSVLKTLLVSDLSSHRGQYIFDVKGPKIKDLRPNDFALSADGSRLAVLNNGSVEVFDLH